MKLRRNLTVAYKALFCIGMGSYLIAGPVPADKPEHYPDWWFERDVIPLLPNAPNSPTWKNDYPKPDDYAAVNQGQLKHIAKQAYDEMQAAGLLDLTTPTVALLDEEWEYPATSTDDYRVINLGQLKNVAEPFYARLVDELGYIGQPLVAEQNRPWSGIADDYALANIGQVKRLFSFSMQPYLFDDYAADSDLDGIPNGWELEHELDPDDPVDAMLMVNGMTNLAIYQASLNEDGDLTAANPAGLVVYTP